MENLRYAGEFRLYVILVQFIYNALSCCIDENIVNFYK